MPPPQASASALASRHARTDPARSIHATSVGWVPGPPASAVTQRTGSAARAASTHALPVMLAQGGLGVGGSTGVTPAPQAGGGGHASRIGSERTGVPVSASSALQTAGAIAGVAGSPTPPGGSLLATITVSTVGAALMRTTG